MGDLDDIQYWHTYVEPVPHDQYGCAAKLAGSNMRCGAGKKQHPEPEPELPEGMGRDIEWEATRE